MKRLNIAVIIVAFTVSICIIEFVYVHKCANEISEKIGFVKTFYSEGDKEKALEYAIKAEDYWEDSVNKIDMLLYHDYIDEITKNITSLKIYIKHDDSVGLYVAANETLAQINSLKNSELPKAENII